MRLTTYLAAALCAVSLAVCPHPAAAAGPGVPAAIADREASLELQLFLFVASSAPGAPSPAPPASLAPSLKRAQALVGLPNARLAATFVQRLTSDAPARSSGVAAPVLPVTQSAYTPVFYEFSADRVVLSETNAGSAVIRNFKFGMRVPVTTAVATSGGQGQTTQYENLGVQSNLSVREGVPAVVSTMSTGRANEAFVLVAVLNRVE